MAARKPNLRAVSPEDAQSTSQRRKATVADAAESGDHRALLVAMRERIAKTVSDPDCPPRDLAALTRRLQDIAKEIDSLDLRAKQEATEERDAASDEAWDEEAI